MPGLAPGEPAGSAGRGPGHLPPQGGDRTQLQVPFSIPVLWIRNINFFIQDPGQKGPGSGSHNKELKHFLPKKFALNFWNNDPGYLSRIPDPDIFPFLDLYQKKH
jgi:hypothetical protein